MKKFYDLLTENEQGFSNQHVAYTWQMIRSHIMSAESYIRAGHDAKAVLTRVVNLVKDELQNLELYLGGRGDKDDLSGVGPDMKPRRPLDKL